MFLCHQEVYALILLFSDLTNLLIQVILSAIMKCSIFIILRPPDSVGKIDCSLFILSGLLSHKNLNNDTLICFSVLGLGLGRAEKYDLILEEKMFL